MQTQTREEIKKIIMTELPRFMESDPDVRRFILDVTRGTYADKTETEKRIDRVLDELKRDREARDKKWEAQEKKWEAQNKKWEGQDKKWVTWEKKWGDERKADAEKLAAWEKKWDGERRADAEKWAAQEKKWEENQKVINEMLASVKKVDSTVGAVGARWGLQAEGALRNGLKGILEVSFGVKVERYEDYDHDGMIFGRPDQVELDVLVYDGKLILCEIKSSISKSEMYIFWRKKGFYEKKHKRKADRAIVISPMIDDRARSVAKDLDIEVYGYAEDVKV